jgi:hypothetical protein
VLDSGSAPQGDAFLNDDTLNVGTMILQASSISP